MGYRKKSIIHELPGLKRDWLSDIKLFSGKKSNILSYSNLRYFFIFVYHPFYELEPH